jgi:hypothetical protein
MYKEASEKRELNPIIYVNDTLSSANAAYNQSQYDLSNFEFI